MNIFKLTTIAFAICTSLAGSQVHAGDLETPSGDVILTVSGNIRNTNDVDVAQFDLEMLQAMDSQTFETSSIWFESVHTFTGVSLSVLLDAVGATGKMIDARAINDYTVNISFPEKDQLYPIVAYFSDGEKMSGRDKGPLWIIYPFDSSSEFQTEVIYSRSIWQLKSITVKN